jgi:hypothetical protein
MGDVSVKVDLNATEIWPDPSWDGWRDAWVVADDAYSTDEKKARELVAAVNAYIAGGGPAGRAWHDARVFRAHRVFVTNG